MKPYLTVLMAWKTSSIFSMTSGLKLSNLWIASRTNSSTSAAAASLVSLRNSISCEGFPHPRFSPLHTSTQTSGHEELDTYYGYDIGRHVREAHAAGVERAHQQLSVLIRVFVLAHVVRLDHLFLQDDHQLPGRRASLNSGGSATAQTTGPWGH